MLMDDATLDPITGLLSRNGGLQAAMRLVRGAADGNTSLVAMWLDLDRFQQVNQSFGHMGGDTVIARIAHRISATISIGRELSRMGSDEFLCLLPGVDKDGAERLAYELLRAIEEPLPVDDILFRPSASIGVALHLPGEDSLAWLERADRALIEAKRQGGNRIIISGEEPVPGRLGVLLAREELAIESDLHTALETGGLQLHFQPILRLDGRIEAVEALMRCNANGRHISPVKFIPVAEKTGLIVRLGEWCLLQGGHYAARLHRAGIPAKVAINVSRAQLTSPKFIQALHGTLICTDVAPALIELELTESLFMDLSEVVQTNLRSARSIGVGLAIDDFGTGFSCLANLKDLPATKLKLDRAFVSVLPEDRRAFAVVKAMTQLAQELGMTVVAEGVETQGQMDALVQAGVDATQGYLHASPMSEDALLAWLEKRKPQ
jgi:diguanylate cyclase (GGDEF)-like protein